MSYNLFLDDYRTPSNCVGYVHSFGIRPDIYIINDWVIVKNYTEFIGAIMTKGLPKMVSFDHDLADIHYAIDFEDWKDNTAEQLSVEETGMDCAKFLVNYCIDNKVDLPEYYVHSVNPVGRKNIKTLLDNYRKWKETNS